MAVLTEWLPHCEPQVGEHACLFQTAHTVRLEERAIGAKHAALSFRAVMVGSHNSSHLRGWPGDSGNSRWNPTPQMPVEMKMMYRSGEPDKIGENSGVDIGAGVCIVQKD